MVQTWYLQKSQKPSCSWYGRPCRTSPLSSLSLLLWSPWASLSTTLLERKAEESVSDITVTSHTLFWLVSKSWDRLRSTVMSGICTIAEANGYNWCWSTDITSSDITEISWHTYIFMYAHILFNWWGRSHLVCDLLQEIKWLMGHRNILCVIVCVCTLWWC